MSTPDSPENWTGSIIYINIIFKFICGFKFEACNSGQGGTHRG